MKNINFQDKSKIIITFFVLAFFILDTFVVSKVFWGGRKIMGLSTQSVSCFRIVDSMTAIQVTVEDRELTPEECETVVSKIIQDMNSQEITVTNSSDKFERQRFTKDTQNKIAELQQKISVNRSKTSQAIFEKWELFLGEDKVSESKKPAVNEVWISEKSFPEWIKGRTGNIKTTLQAFFKIPVKQEDQPSKVKEFINNVLNSTKIVSNESYDVKISFQKEEDYDFRCQTPPGQCRRWNCEDGEEYQGGLRCPGVDNYCCKLNLLTPTPINPNPVFKKGKCTPPDFCMPSEICTKVVNGKPQSNFDCPGNQTCCTSLLGYDMKAKPGDEAYCESVISPPVSNCFKRPVLCIKCLMLTIKVLRTLFLEPMGICKTPGMCDWMDKDPLQGFPK